MSDSASRVLPSYDDAMETASSTEAPPHYADRPLQFVFTSLDVLNSTVIQAHSGETAFVSTTQESYTILKNGKDDVLVTIIWHEEPQLDFNGSIVKLKKWMSRAKDESALFNIHHKKRSYELYTAGKVALGLRERGSRNMLCGIRDPNKYVEIVIPPQGVETSVLEVAVICSVLLKSKKPLGAEFEGHGVADKLWKGLDYAFRSVGRDSVAGLGPAAGIGRDRM